MMSKKREHICDVGSREHICDVVTNVIRGLYGFDEIRGVKVSLQGRAGRVLDRGQKC